MTRLSDLSAESKSCEILLFLTADRRFDRKVKCPTGRASFGSNSPLYGAKRESNARGLPGGGGGWAVLELTATLFLGFCHTIPLLENY